MDRVRGIGAGGGGGGADGGSAGAGLATPACANGFGAGAGAAGCEMAPDAGGGVAWVLNGFAVGAGAKGLLAGVAAVDCVPRSRAFSSFNRSTSSTSDVTWVMSVCTRAWSQHAMEHNTMGYFTTHSPSPSRFRCVAGPRLAQWPSLFAAQPVTQHGQLPSKYGGQERPRRCGRIQTPMI